MKNGNIKKTKLTAKFSVVMTPKERAQVKAAARASKVSVSAWARQVLIGVATA